MEAPEPQPKTATVTRERSKTPQDQIEEAVGARFREYQCPSKVCQDEGCSALTIYSSEAGNGLTARQCEKKPVMKLGGDRQEQCPELRPDECAASSDKCRNLVKKKTNLI